jgi:hypothetical protein
MTEDDARVRTKDSRMRTPGGGVTMESHVRRRQARGSPQRDKPHGNEYPPLSSYVTGVDIVVMAG